MESKATWRIVTVRLDDECVQAISLIRHALDTVVTPGEMSNASDAVRFALLGAAAVCKDLLESQTFVPAEEEGNGKEG